MNIRKVESADAEKIANIYNHYIQKTIITFEEEPVTSEEMGKRIQKVTQSDLPWVVAELDGDILGYAYAAKWHERSAYRFTVEPSIYLSSHYKGKGLGRKLYTILLDHLKKNGIQNVIGVIALPNEPSIGLHEALNFKKVGEFPDVGYKFNTSISVGYWQLKLAALP